MDKIKSLGARALVLPFVVATLLAFVFGCAMMPMLLLNITDVQFGVVNLDEGGTTFAGTTNIGDTMIDNMTSGDGLNALGSGDDADENSSSTGISSIDWTVYDSKESLMDAIDAGDVYGGLIIPKNFTAQQMLNATGLGNAPTLTVYLNQAKNPMMVNMMQPTLINMMNKSGICVDVEVLNQVDLGGGGSMSFMVALMALVMPLYIVSILGGVLASVVLWPRGASRKKRGIAAVKQLVFVAIFALFGSAIVLCIDLVGGLDIPMDRALPFMYVAMLAMMLPFMGCADIKIPLVVLLAVVFMSCGQGTIMYSPDMLPEPWSSYIAPWVPQASIGEGLRSILYMGNGPFEAGMTALVGWIIAGLALVAVAVIRPDDAKTDEAGIKPISAGDGVQDNLLESGDCAL